MSQIRVTVEYIPDRGTIEKWGNVCRIPKSLTEKLALTGQLTELMAGTIARVVKLP